jgi:transglutaminase-like putative cysteine protease
VSAGLLETIRRANRTRTAEDSVALRIAVLGAVMAGAFALALETAISVPTAVGVLVLMPVAYYISYRRRREDNWHIKLALTAAAIIGLIRFFGQLRGIATLDEVRFPLADLFLWVQVIHSFDLPARKDLNFSLGASLTLMAVAGSISQDLRFLLPLLAYLGFGGAALILSYRSELNEGSQGWARPKRAGPSPERDIREPARAFAITLVVAALLFMVVPRPQGTRTFALPFSFGSGLGSPGLGGIANPGFLDNPLTRTNAAAYYGFGSEVDLRVRGDLPDDLVMRVRASAPAMWRGLAFGRYDGTRWSLPDADPVPLSGDAPYAYPIEFRSLGPRQEVVETFYIEREQANVVFSGGQPDAVWFEGSLSVDQLGSLRTDSTLTPGTVYSVVSSRGAGDPDHLRSIPEAEPDDRTRRYLQLPAELPERVGRLAARITRDAPTPYDKVKAIERWLADNYRYRIESPVPPEGRDAVDHFLFDTDVGFCEQFASATAIMLRSLGIPARVVVGFTPGKRSAFTGYYNVRASDAHMWVEVFFDELGWYEFDPTFAVPPAEFDLGETVPLVKAMRVIIEKISAVIPAGMGGVFRGGLVLLLVLTAVIGGYIAYRKLYRPRVGVPSRARDPDLGPVGRAFASFENAFVGSRRRRSDETASEFMARSLGTLPAPSASALRAFEKERYAGDDPTPDEERAAIEELQRLGELTGVDDR